MAVETWGVDVAFVETFWPNIKVTTQGPVTSARVLELITQASALVNGITKGLGFDIPTLAADTASDEYANIRGLVMKVLAPDVHTEAYGSTSASFIEDLWNRRIQCLEDYRRTPANLGAEAETPSRVRGSVAGHDLDTSATSRVNRKTFNRLKDQTNGLPDKQFYF